MADMMLEIFKNITLNVSLLVLIAFLLTKARIVREFISDDSQRWQVKLGMAVIFGMIGILSTYTGIRVEGAIANTRVIGVVAGGILGGPFVGILAGLIAGGHRFLIDVGGFTAVACGVSTITEGLIGGLFSKYIKRSRNDWVAVMTVTMLAELVQMAIILLIARPIDRAWQLVEVISLPMILFNSIGVAIFTGIFDSVFIDQDKEAARRISLVLDIADRCLPHLRKGLYDKENLDAATAAILELAEAAGVAITDRRSVLSIAGVKLKKLQPDSELPRVVKQTIETGLVQIAEDTEKDDAFFEPLKKLTVVCAPLTQKDGEVIGTLILFIRKFKLTREVECGFASGLARLFSTQLELSQVDYQKKLLQKAEFAALQSQINPHFLFNALSTITSFCREKPARARELLIILSNYFRNTLQTGHYMISLCDELEHVNAYLELEKARFEEKLQIEVRVPDSVTCILPSFILQPLVENAVKHGAMNAAGVGRVSISASEHGDEVLIAVSDNGGGIPPALVERLYTDTMDGKSVGLANVHKRLKSIYGAEYGLQIESSPNGTTVTLHIPHTTTGGEAA